MAILLLIAPLIVGLEVDKTWSGCGCEEVFVRTGNEVSYVLLA